MNQEVLYRRCDYQQYLQSNGQYDAPAMPRNILFFLAETKGVVVGEIAFSKASRFHHAFPPSSVFIHRVDAYYPGRGIGGRLVHLVEDEASREGIKTVTLQSENHGFWEHLGYELPDGFERVKSCIKRLGEHPALSTN